MGTLFWIAVALGVVEGVTEFVPVSSTGHLILAGTWLAFPEDKAAAFEIFIQLGAVLAVVWFYRERIAALMGGVTRDASAQAFVGKLLVAFVPAAVVGLALHDWIVEVLFGPLPVAAGLAVGGALLLAIDRPNRPSPATRLLDDVGWGQAFAIGCAQVASLWPGVSRSGATIIGALLAGLSRSVALEFSFFLAIPTLTAAALYDLYKHRSLLGTDDLALFGVGFVAAFLSALLAVRALIRYVAHHDFTVFVWYRIVFGVIVLATAWFGWVDWSTAG